MSVIIVAGPLANKYRNGGGTWERMSWAVGLRRLGFDVYFLEQIAPESCVDAEGRKTSFADSVNVQWFRSVTEWFDLANNSALICSDGECVGMTWYRLLELADSTDLLVNLSGHLTHVMLMERIRCKAYIDVDPGFTQFWHVDPKTPFQLGGHDFYFTIGENIGLPDCRIPTGGICWHPIRQPVVLEDWPLTESHAPDRFTTVASWRGPFGPVQFNGKTYGLKVHEFRKFIEMPQRLPNPFEIALAIHDADSKDRIRLEQNGWRLVEPSKVSGEPASFRRYIQESGAEFSVAQGIYVETNSGWFSDRTIRYLASGKPALVQDTGFTENLPVGEGLVAFRTLDEAVQGAEIITTDYERHSKAAREIALEYFDSDKILKRMLAEIGLMA